MRRRLNELTIRSLPFSDTHYDVWDESLPRFGLRIGKRTKTFVINAGKRRISLGRVGIVTLKQARDEARRRIGAKFLPAVSPNAQDAAQWYLDAIQGQRSPATVRAYDIYHRRLPRQPLQELNTHNLYAA
ncbi:MAG: integrase arm-type DNA-binding domain-containing protein, partial [Hyphomicrobiaceae bacterium]